MDPEPQITPLGSASKKINVRIFDTLRPNTTYAINFGQSIVDNNEENPFSFFKYVFSTGSFIDSLTLAGNISDAFDRTTENFVSVMLYEIDSSYTDSAVYKRKPDYITNTLDSAATFNFENLKPGKYKLIALKDENSNFTFEQASDKIGFIDDFIEIPTDKVLDVQLFKEELDFKVFRPRLAGNQKISFGYSGDPQLMKIRLLSEVPSEYRSRITKAGKADTLQYWFKPGLEMDSLLFEISGPVEIDTFSVRLREQVKDSLVISPVREGPETFGDPFQFEANLPIDIIESSRIKLIDKDSAAIDFSTRLDSMKNLLKLEFEKTQSNIYRLKLLPGAIQDFFGNTNDTLNFSMRTKALNEYGNLRLILRNGKYPLIVQLINQSENIVAERYVTTSDPIDFTNLNPANYYVRVIFDENGNGKYDPGNFLLKRQSERVSYFPEVIELRASWNFIEEFILEE